MKFSGRIISCIVTLGYLIGCFIYYGNISLGNFIVGFIAGVIAWWIGYSFDMSRIQTKQLRSLKRSPLEELDLEEKESKIQGRLSLIYDSVSDLIFLMEVVNDDYFLCISVNQSYLNLTGLTKKQIIYKEIREILPFESANFAVRNYKQVLQSKEMIRYEETIRLPIGELITETKLQPIMDSNGTVTHLLGVARDITERKKMEVEIEESQQRYKSLFEYNPHASYALDLNGFFTGINEAAMEITGYRKEELIRSPFLPLVAPKDHEKIKAYFEQALQGESSVFEVGLIRKDQQEIGLKATVVPIIVKGEISGIVGIAEDITERKRLEDEIQKSHDRMEMLMKTAKIGTAIIAMEEGRFLEADEVCQQILGYSEEELKNKPFTEITYPEDIKQNTNLYQELLDGKRDHYHIEKRYIRKDGRMIWGNLTVCMMYYNQTPTIMAIIQDITKRRHLENRIRESEEKYRLIAENMSDFLAVLTTGGTVIYASPSHQTYLGLDPEQYVGSMPLSFIHPDDIADVKRAFIEALHKNCTFVREFRWKHGNGDWVTLETHGSPVIGDDGEIQQIVFVSRDITQRKKAEQKLQTANELLQSLSHRDGLTEIANRRHFDQALEEECRRSIRQSSPMSLLLLDIDYFKNYNDTYGHLGGDACLKAIAQVLGKSVNRPGDLAARYGGEEFAIILSQTDQAGAEYVAEKIRFHIEALQMPHIGSKVSNVVTVSIGIFTVIPNLFFEPRDLVHAADKALYQAKKLGRNQVVIYNKEQVFGSSGKM